MTLNYIELLTLLCKSLSHYAFFPFGIIESVEEAHWSLALFPRPRLPWSNLGWIVVVQWQ